MEMGGGRYLLAGEYRLDRLDERLWVDGQASPLGGKALALLRVLMEQPQLLVTKDELFERVWPGVIVSEAVLTTAVKEARRALADDARQPRAIETVHRRGYRFLLPVTACDEAAPRAEPVAARAPRPVARRWTPALGAAAAALFAIVAAYLLLVPRSGQAAPHPKSLAVMPFKDLSPAQDQRWFADGLTEEIMAALARTPDLRVASEFRRASPEIDPERLRIAHLLEGSVRRTGGRTRVTVQLVRTDDGTHLWSKSYDRGPSDVISIQEDVAFDIARALKTVLDPAKLRAMVSAGTRSVEAYEAFLRALSFDQRQFDEGELDYARKAADEYERARALDPGFAAAHWRAAQTWFGNATRVDSTIRAGELTERERLARFFERIDAAIATSRDPTEALKYGAARATMQLRPKEAHRLMMRYLEARPRDAAAWEQMGDYAAYAGERRWMARAAERIHALTMEGGAPASRAITLSTMALELDDAVKRAREQLEVNSDRALTLYQAHRAMVWAGELGEARALLRRIRGSGLPRSNKALAELRQACAEGRRADAVAAARTAVGDGDLSGRWNAANMLGDKARAKALLQPLDTPERLPTLMQYMIHPTFEPRDYPVLSAALGRAGVSPPRAAAVPYGCRT